MIENRIVEFCLMKSLSVTLALVGLVAMSNASALRDEINSMNKKVGKCIIKRDIDGFTKLVKGGVTSDFKYSEDGKVMNFDEMVAMMKQGFAQQPAVTSANSTIVSLKEKGNAATAVCKHVMSGTMMGPDKKKHKFSMTGLSTETYKKIGKDWKMATMSWKNGDFMVDGKKADPAMMGGGGGAGK